MKDQSSPTELCPFCGKAFKRLKSHLPYCKMADTRNKSPAMDHTNKNTTAVSKVAVKNVNAMLPGEVAIQDSKLKGKSKTDVTEHVGRPKKQLQKDNATSSSQITQPKMTKPALRSRVPCVTQQKAIESTKGQCSKKDVDNINLGKPNDNVKSVLTEDSTEKNVCIDYLKKDLTAQTLSGTNEVATLLREQSQAPVPVMAPSAKVLLDISARSDTERKVPAIAGTVSMNNTWQNLNARCRQVLNESFGGTEKECARLPDQFSEKTGHNTQGGVANNSIVLWDQFQSSLTDKPFHEQGSLVLQQCSETSSPCTESSLVSIYGLSSTLVQESFDTQLLPSISPTLHSENMHKTAMCNIPEVDSIGKYMESNLDLLSPQKIVPVVDVEPENSTLGLQWIPHLYSNYVRQCIAPGRQDQWSLDQRWSEIKEPTELKPELCKPACCKSVTDSQLASRHLMDVRLGKLPTWLADQRFSMKRFPELVQNAWGRYYNKYINVRKGGVGGLAMLLAGYCVLSYSWNFHHIKQDRWRKYH
ncbi:mitochondrial nucleoid-associated protein 1 isoform X2 [Mixophyes fleayi]